MAGVDLHEETNTDSNPLTQTHTLRHVHLLTKSMKRIYNWFC